jgi:thioredoxin-related protein
MKTRRALLVLLLGVCISVQAFGQAGTKVKSEVPLWTPLEKFDETRNPTADLKLAVQEAIRSNRRILLDVGGEWCIWCHRLDTLFIRNADLARFLNDNFVVVKVHYDNKKNRNEAFLLQYPKIPGYPHFFVLEKNGRFLVSQNTGELEEGKGHSKEKVLAFLQKWSPKKK